MSTVKVLVYKDDDVDQNGEHVCGVIAEFDIVVTDPANTTFIAVTPTDVKVTSPNEPKVTLT